MMIPQNTVQSVIQYFTDKLDGFYDDKEINNMLYILLEHYFGMSKVDVTLNKTKRLSESDLLKIIYAIKDLKKYRPLAYILGEWEFYGLKLTVNQNTLIPRPETEELVSLIIEDNKRAKDLTIIDIGAGSGCIAIALKKNLPNAQVSAWDVSEKALEVVNQNAQLNQLSIETKKVDILKETHTQLTNKIDIVVSNPPYITHQEKTEMSENVLNYEPHLALFVENHEPLVFYKAIADFAASNLKIGGKLYFEINEKYGNEVKEMLENKAFDKVKIGQDINDKDRIVYGEK